MKIDIYPSQDATQKIQNAIDTLSASGGGKVVLHDGEYVLKTVLLRSDVQLYLKAGAVVKGSRNVDDYDFSQLLTCPNGADYKSAENCPVAYLGRGYVKPSGSVDPFSRWSRALIKAYRAKNISIIGESGALFDGQNVYDALGEEGYRGSHFVNFHECENITLKGYTLQNSSNWGHALFTSSHIYAEDITVLAGHDGLDVLSCDDVTVKNCDFKTGDDCIAGYDCCNVTVENCRFNTSCNALRIGGNRFVVRNCTFNGPGEYGHRYALTEQEKMSGSIARADNARTDMLSVIDYYCDFRFAIRKSVDIAIENCTVENCNKLINYGFTDPKQCWAKNVPMERLTFTGVRAKGIKQPSVLYAPADTPLRLEFADCDFSAHSENFALFEHTDFAFRNVRFAQQEPYLTETNGKRHPIRCV